MSGYGVPCSGELEFWFVAKSQLKTIATQLTRIADALEAANARRSGPHDLRIGDIVAWKDPEGGSTDGWKVARTPPFPDPNSTVSIVREDGTRAEVFSHELTLLVTASAAAAAKEQK